MTNRKNIFDIIETDEKFSILLEILNKTGMDKALRQEKNPFTFFAPTDGAFYQLFQKTANGHAAADRKILITSILGQHLIPGVSLYSDDLRRRKSVTALKGNVLEIRQENHRLFLDDAQILSPGIAATNGVVFAVDKVLLK